MEKEKELKLPANQINVKIGINEYSIKFPNNGQLIEIERNKNRLTGGTGQNMLMGDAAAVQAFMLSEAISTFTVLIPQLKTDLTVPSLLDLNPYQSKSLIKAYEKYYRWMEEWRTVLNQDIEEEEGKKDAE